MIFQPAARYPADPRVVFILVLSIFSGATALALESAPESLEVAVPHWAVTTWSVMLVLGSATTLIGMAFQGLNGIITEQIGSVMVGATALFYTAVAIASVGPDVVSTAGVIGAWGFACLARWLQLQVLINSAHRRQTKQAIVAKVYAELEARAARERERAIRRPGGHA